MKRLLILFVCVALMIIPVFAQTYSVEAPTGKCFVNMYIVSNEGTTGTIVFQQQNGQTITGSFSYETVVDLYGYSLVRRGGIATGAVSESRDYVTPGQLYTMFYHVPGVANITQNRLSGYMDQSKVSLWPAVETDTTASPIIKYIITSNAEIEHWEDTADITAQGGLLATGSDDWIKKSLELAYSSFWAVYDFLTSLLYWIKFFFVDNLALILALFLAVPMAFAAKNSRGNPERFMRQYFKTLRGFFEFIFQVWRLLTEIIGTVIGWFKLI
jgi:hypothetical protein